MGMLVQYTSEIAGRVIFGEWVQYVRYPSGDLRACTVSHEWLSLGHAGKFLDNCVPVSLTISCAWVDPQGEQLRELQRLLIRMMKGISVGQLFRI